MQINVDLLCANVMEARDKDFLPYYQIFFEVQSFRAELSASESDLRIRIEFFTKFFSYDLKKPTKER